MRDIKSPTRMDSGMDTMLSCIFNLCDVRVGIAMTCIATISYLRGLWGSFIRGESVNEKLN